MENKYINTIYGLTGESDFSSENGQLFLVELILLQNLLGVDYRNNHDILYEQLNDSKVKKGLYNRNPLLITRCTSHDNLSAIFSFCSIFHKRQAEEIWNYLLKHLGTYDNTQGKSKQLSRFLPFNPSNFFIWGLCAESKIYLIFLPFFWINLVLTCNKSENITTGKLLSWVELLPHKDHWIVKYFYKYFEKKMIQMYGNDYLKQLFSIYFKDESKEFPIKAVLKL